MSSVRQSSPSRGAYWTKNVQQKLALKTAQILQSWNEDGSVSKQRMMAAFRQSIKQTRPNDSHRNIQYPSQVPWLQDLVLATLQPPPPVKTIPFEKTPPTPSTDDYGLVLDTLTSLEKKLDELTKVVAGLEANVKGLGHVILKRRARKAARAPVAALPTKEASPLKVAIVGVPNGKQKNRIEQAMKGFPYGIDLHFNNPNRDATHIPHFDHLIIMPRVPVPWRTRALKTFSNRVHLATTASEAVHVLHKLGVS